MDSPVFGRAEHKAPTFRRSSPEPAATSSKETQLAMAVLILTKNIRQLNTAFRRVELKNKRNAFIELLHPSAQRRVFVSQK